MARVRLSDDEARALGVGHLIPKRVARAAGVDERGMNKLEAKYARRLDDMKYMGVVRDYWFESVKFRLAERTFLTPDFVVVMPDGLMEVHETKGWWRDDARAKTKIAAEKFWHIRWLGVRWVNRGWEFEEIPGYRGRCS